ncbi:MAG: hypothetical protein CMJ50_05255 [Planctomycetaceae bacterium]|nr:hypothetical protein [Planctomycetaceae bacterium]
MASPLKLFDIQCEPITGFASGKSPWPCTRRGRGARFSAVDWSVGGLNRLRLASNHHKSGNFLNPIWP